MPSRAFVALVSLFPAAAALAQPAEFYTADPCRAYDSRTAGAGVVGSTPRAISVSGVCGVPTYAIAVSFNVTAVSPSAAGLLILRAAGTSGGPETGLATLVSGRTRANNRIVSLSAGGQVEALTSAGTTDLVLDVTGYFAPDPLAANDSYSTPFETALAVSAPGVLNNDATYSATLASYGAATGTEQTTIGAATPTAHAGSTSLNADGSFDYTPATGFRGDDTFQYVLRRGASSSTATVTITVGCGDNAPTVDISDQTLGKAFDDHALTATAHSIDDDPAQCPARFANSQYTFAWHVAPAAPGSHFQLIPGAGTATTSLEDFAAGDNDSYTVSVTATGDKTPAAGTGSTVIGVSCSTPVRVAPPTIQSGASVPLVSGNFNRDDSVQLAAAVDVSSCYSNAASAGLTYAWLLTPPAGSGATLNSSTAASPAFTVDRPNSAYGVSVIVVDKWGHSSGNSSTFQSSGCGAYPVVVTLFVTPGRLPMDPYAVAATSTTRDDDPVFCPARFANAGYSFSWQASPADASTLVPATTANTIFTPSTPNFYSIQATSIGSPNGQSGSASASIDARCGSPAVPPVLVGSINGSADTGQGIAPGDLVVPAVNASSRCQTGGHLNYAWSWFPNDGSTFTPLTVAAPTFVPANDATTYTLFVTVTDDFSNASGNSLSFTTKSGQTITFTSTPPVDATVGGPDYTVTATASSTLPVALTVDAAASAVCSISGVTVSFQSSGTCVIDANQPGNAGFAPAPQASQSWTVAP